MISPGFSFPITALIVEGRAVLGSGLLFNAFVASVLDLLVRARLRLTAVVVAVVGIGLVVLGHWLDTLAVLAWVTASVQDLGRLLAGAGLLGIFIEYVLRELGDLRVVQKAREAFRAEAPAIRDSVWDSWDIDPSTLKDNASIQRLERVVVNGLGVLFGDSDLAREWYANARRQIIAAPERWRDVSVTVDLTPWRDGPASGPDSMFTAVVRWEYRVVPAGGELRFACVSDPAEYRALLRDPTIASVWLYDQPAPLDAGSRQVYELVAFTADGQPCPIRRAHRVGSQLYTVSLPNLDPGAEVVVAYTYTVLVQRHGHLLYLDVPRPSKGLRVRFNYSGSGIRRATVQDFIASADTPRLERSPASAPGQSAGVGFDGWVFPRAGAALAWTLDNEFCTEAAAPAAQQ